jgi:hypothetical protein
MAPRIMLIIRKRLSITPLRGMSFSRPTKPQHHPADLHSSKNAAQIYRKMPSRMTEGFKLIFSR